MYRSSMLLEHTVPTLSSSYTLGKNGKTFLAPAAQCGDVKGRVGNINSRYQINCWENKKARSENRDERD